MNTLTLQSLAVALVVTGCMLYATWKLMPAAPRRWFAAWMLRTSPQLPGLLSAPLRRAALAGSGSGCGCDGCDHAKPGPGGPPSAAQPVRFHRRPPR